ncbi:hypothetical protein HacjB3_16921 (plasmid) [Halalkalicoccus jeotgali B3]|uniref:Uncharacterized protein n=1 Tax=Halalkalicoccus jeotgali (strain DSM 18796 / CECT 7217 / JCM 14584 / KCTC 4019 / B3) TaxID=795797 RepID=D8JBT1_HALJB|nr:hypothetical protein HacjB3_16921 [Halalkalicoccus jeotgali B3]
MAKREDFDIVAIEFPRDNRCWIDHCMIRANDLPSFISKRLRVIEFAVTCAQHTPLEIRYGFILWLNIGQ